MRAKLHFVLSITMFFGWFYGIAQQDYWKKVDSRAISTAPKMSDQGLRYTLDNRQFMEVLGKVGKEEGQIVQFPDHKGNLHSFQVGETPVIHPDLAKKYPLIRSFTGISLNGKAKIRFSHSQNGLQAMTVDLEKGDTYFLERERGSETTYRAFRSRAVESKFKCSTTENAPFHSHPVARNFVDGRILRKYRIAVSASGEYTDYHGGTVADALAAINATLTRINEVFETDLAVTLELIPDNDQIIFTDATTDPYDRNFNVQIQNTLTTVIGEANYDVGHLFHKSSNGGNAGFIGSVCVDNKKGSAYSSSMEPEGNLYDLDYVSHELGHQFGANHTFSYVHEGTGVQAEPASGTTIMAYAGIVNVDNVAPNGDDYFHHLSIAQIQDYLLTTNCSMNISLVNGPPTINAQPNYKVPKGTAFVLSGEASDGDDDVLTYTWEQIDHGVVTASTFGPENTSGANFRSLPPTNDPDRYFPHLSQVLQGALEQVNPGINDSWETVSNVGRELNFALTVRDNNAEGGQVAWDFVSVDVVHTAGPFRVTSQNTNVAYSAGSIQDISWDVANTNLAPINTEAVDIYLSTDGGASFSVLLAQNVPNTGSARVQIPGMATTAARIMVKGNNTIFFSVNDTEFSIVETPAILRFFELDYSGCQPGAITIPFVYESYGGFSEDMVLDIVAADVLVADFSQPSVSANGTAMDLTLGNIENVPTGIYPIEVIATGESFSTSVTLEVGIYNDMYTDVALTFPQDLATQVILAPRFTWQENDNYSTYDIEIATDTAFANLVESATVSFAWYQSSTLLPDTSYFWRVKPRNQCGEGTFGPSFGFTTDVIDCSGFDANDLPQEIDIQETSTSTAKIYLSEDLPVHDIDVHLGITHTYLGDLTISLTSPAGTKVVLFSQDCGDRNNISAVFDDDGADISCSFGEPAISGIVKPFGSLSSFIGESTQGEWVLEVVDSVISDGGSLDTFSLDICIEGWFRPDADGDGVFDDGNDLCLDTPEGTLVDNSGCPIYTFPTNNFSVSVQSESCRGNNDGAISIAVMDTTIDYSATLVGNGVILSDEFVERSAFSGLSPGNYQLCITGSAGDTEYRETCYGLVIERPERLDVHVEVSADGRAALLQMSGAEFYNIELNGSVIQTFENETAIELDLGENSLKVTTGWECQGVFEQQLFITDAPSVLPNPATEWIRVRSIFKGQGIKVAIFSDEGRLVRRDGFLVDDYIFSMDVSNLSSGLYYLVLESEGMYQSTKFLKQ